MVSIVFINFYDRGVMFMMDSKLETLIKVNETRSFTKAAELLSLTQPAVSQHIRQ